MVRRARRGEGDEDNPAWPGLVDLFALGMVIILLMWAAHAGGTNDEPPTGPPPIEREVERRLEHLETSLRALLGDSVERVELRKDPLRLDIATKVRFKTGEYALSDTDGQSVSTVASALVRVLRANQDTLLMIGGKADSRPFLSDAPPRDNVELSALRATEVTRIVFALATDGVLRNRISVRGLGEQGEALAGKEDSEELRKLRTVTFEIHVDRAVLLGAMRHKQ